MGDLDEAERILRETVDHPLSAAVLAELARLRAELAETRAALEATRLDAYAVVSAAADVLAVHPARDRAPGRSVYDALRAAVAEYRATGRPVRGDAPAGHVVAECPECGQDVPATLAPGLTVPADDTATPDRDALRRITAARQLAAEAIDERARAATGKGRYTAQEYVEMDGAAALAEQILAALNGPS